MILGLGERVRHKCKWELVRGVHMGVTPGRADLIKLASYANMLV